MKIYIVCADNGEGLGEIQKVFTSKEMANKYMDLFGDDEYITLTEMDTEDQTPTDIESDIIKDDYNNILYKCQYTVNDDEKMQTTWHETGITAKLSDIKPEYLSEDGCDLNKVIEKRREPEYHTFEDNIPTYENISGKYVRIYIPRSDSGYTRYTVYLYAKNSTEAKSIAMDKINQYKISKQINLKER